MKYIDLQPGDVVSMRDVNIHVGDSGVVRVDKVRKRQTILILSVARIFREYETLGLKKTHCIHYLEDGIQKEREVTDFLNIPQNADVIRDGKMISWSANLGNHVSV